MSAGLDDEIILTVANLSRFVQCVQLDLSAFRGTVPVELFGQTEFPPIGDLPYFITLGPHGFYWFKLDTAQTSARAPEETQAPVIEIAGAWDQVITGSAKPALEKILPRYLQNRRWFGGKARRVRAVKVTEAIPMPFDSIRAYFAVVEVTYGEGDPEFYVLPLAFAGSERAGELLQSSPEAVIAQLKTRRAGAATDGVLFDAVFDRMFRDALLDAIARRRSFHGPSSAIVMVPAKNFRKLRGPANVPLEPALPKKEQSNTSIAYGDRLILKLFRRLQEGVNPDLEISRFITEATEYPHTPTLAGYIEFHKDSNASASLGILQSWVRNEGDAWTYTLETLCRLF